MGSRDGGGGNASSHMSKRTPEWRRFGQCPRKLPYRMCSAISPSCPSRYAYESTNLGYDGAAHVRHNERRGRERVLVHLEGGVRVSWLRLKSCGIGG